MKGTLNFNIGTKIKINRIQNSNSQNIKYLHLGTIICPLLIDTHNCMSAFELTSKIIAHRLSLKDPTDDALKEMSLEDLEKVWLASGPFTARD